MKYQKTNKNAQFKGAHSVAKKAADQTLLAKGSLFFAEAGGEKVANMVNAGGKMLIAPLIIAFNPFTKESKETKAYSAWKQPIEAVLTIAIQLSALGKVDKVIDKMAKNGELAEHFNLKNLAKGSADFEKVSKRLGVFKDRVGILVALAAIPVVTTITNWAYPKIMKKIMPQVTESKEVDKK